MPEDASFLEEVLLRSLRCLVLSLLDSFNTLFTERLFARPFPSRWHSIRILCIFAACSAEPVVGEVFGGHGSSSLGPLITQLMPACQALKS